MPNPGQIQNDEWMTFVLSQEDFSGTIDWANNTTL